MSPFAYFENKMLQHNLSSVKISYDTFPQGANSNYISGGSAQHLLSVSSNSQDFPCLLIYSYHGGLMQNNAFTS